MSIGVRPCPELTQGACGRVWKVRSLSSQASGFLIIRQDLIAKTDYLIRIKTVHVLFSRPVCIHADGEPDGCAIGKLDDIIDGGGALGVLAEESRLRATSKGDRDRLSRTAGAAINEHGDWGCAHQLNPSRRMRFVQARDDPLEFCFAGNELAVAFGRAFGDDDKRESLTSERGEAAFGFVSPGEWARRL